jgi:hypothetical protein
MENVFILNSQASHQAILENLYEKTTQAKALVECIMLAILSKELKTELIFEAIWGIESFLSQMKELQNHLDH